MTQDQFNAWLDDPARRARVMGVLNVTPDSFSDGGRYSDVTAAVARAHELAGAGADVIDVGGESTRPGSEPVGAAEQIRRVVPVIRAVAGRIPAVISIDTGLAQVAEAALDAGATIINDIYGGTLDPHLIPVAAKQRVPLVLMHMQGRPATMQRDPRYTDVMAEVIEFLRGRIETAVALGVERSRILIDPGIGFGKAMGHNLELIRRLSELKMLGRPTVVGVSRKGFIGRITGEDVASGRPFGTAAAVAWALASGADLVRVHDVGPMSQVVRMIGAIQTGTSPEIAGPR